MENRLPASNRVRATLGLLVGPKRATAFSKLVRRLADRQQGCQITIAHKVIAAILNLRASGEVDGEVANEVRSWLDLTYEAAVLQIVEQVGLADAITMLRMIDHGFRLRPDHQL